VAEAAANAERARRLQESGFYSAQMGSQYLTGEQTARARLDAARAKARADEIRLAQTHIVAPDDGIVSARAATVGSLTKSGEELFRLIRGGRLEWRARVAEADLGRIAPGTLATLTLPGGAELRGRVRAVAPSVDPATRDGLVYVDLPAAGDATRAGMFARGAFELGHAAALSLPQTAVVVRDGFAYVYRLEGSGQAGLGKVAQTKVALGRRVGDRIEIVAGLKPDARVVAAGTGFLADGDSVRVVAAGTDRKP
jgi:RND family efflux transporter MFP subunit